jgi:serine/threonine-protein kinase
VATVLVGIGGVVAVSTVERRSTVAAVDPAVTARTDPPSTRPAVLRTDDPSEALEQIRAQDAPTVASLAESWVAQLSARPAATATTDRAATDAAVLSGHEALRKRYPGSVLLWSPDWNYAGRSWITVMNKPFSTAEEANTWCDRNRFAPQDCFAKKLSRSGTVDGSERYRR